jgi:hypothetical protein
LLPGLKQLVERFDLARDRRGREVIHALEGQIHVQVPLARQGVRDLERHARLHRLHAFVEVVHGHFEELAVRHLRQRLDRVAR